MPSGCKDEVVIPRGQCWLEGDNAYDSTDSRYYGPVPLALVRGVVFLKLWPFREAGWISRTKPPPPPPPAYEQYQYQPPSKSAAEPYTFPAGEPGEGVQDPALQELLSRDASANEAFKREVERMVRDAARKEELDARAGGAPPAKSVVADTKDISGSTVPFGHFLNAAALLNSVSLPQYIKSFEEEEMDPDTLIEVLQQQGKASLEEALKELGIKSMGHRLKIVNALIIQ
uniref:Mitochondrial inner membrane protease subunit n=1 Tax=Haptolina brevifila TaxID=156173 RepID=A0A7S2G0Y4_9EUKA|mmetsp:Transcript_25006/g.50247  ORF Transcript_25006/g.50247 Transcript_25006/m.50247 type:complete len:230 (+) Transcript_25006:1-690(+)